jgi:tetratricopeptide (TPR) repeat protein
LRKKYRINIFSIFFAVSLITILLCQAEEKKINPTLEKGIGQYKHENYDEALVTLKKARDEEPASTLAAYYLGLTYKQLQNYGEAVTPLRNAVTYSPKIKGALIELIDCLYQLNQLDEAKQWISEAEREGIRPAQIAFLKGLVLVKAGSVSDGIDSFKTAKELDSSMAQACNYQIGVADLKANKFDDAKKVFRDVVLVDPSSNMANYANEYIGALSRREEAEKPFRFSTGFAWQYDDNVVLQPASAGIVTNITDKADSREVYTAQAEYNHKFNDLLGIKGQYFFYYAKQNNLGFYDTLSNTFAIQPSIYYQNSLFTFPLGWSLTNVDDKFYLSSPSAAGVYNLMLNDTNMFQAFARYQAFDYNWPPIIPQENRDGSELGGGIGWYSFFAKNKGFVNLKYSANRDWTDGNNWNFVGNRMAVTVLIPFWDKLNWTVTGDCFLQDFTRSNSIFGAYRKDQVYTLSTLVAYKFYKDSEIQAQYTFVKDDSNLGIYSYNRNITSIGVEIKF